MKILFCFLICLALNSNSFSQENHISKKEAISIITSNPLFQVYNDYLKKKYHTKKTYEVSIKEMSLNLNDDSIVYFVDFNNVIENLENGDIAYLRFFVDTKTGKVKIDEPILLMNDLQREILKNPDEYFKRHLKENH